MRKLIVLLIVTFAFTHGIARDSQATLIGDIFDILIITETGDTIHNTVEFIAGETDGDEVVNEYIDFNNNPFWFRVWTTHIDNQGLDGFYIGVANMGDTPSPIPSFSLSFQNLGGDDTPESIIDVEAWAGIDMFSVTKVAVWDSGFTLLFDNPYPGYTMGPESGRGTDFYIHTVTNAPVPEPATMLLFGTGLLGLAGVGIRRKKK